MRMLDATNARNKMQSRHKGKCMVTENLEILKTWR